MYTTHIGDYQISTINSEEFHVLKREVFSQHVYYLDLEFDHPPRIIDAGAHVGLATLYFKSIWPEAQIVAIEPNPDLADLLRKNIKDNQLSDVAVLEAALSDHEGHETLHVDDSWDRWYSSGSLHEFAWNNAADTMPVSVPAVTLDSILADDLIIDVLKMDIEGAERKVLAAAGENLKKVQHLIMEYHPREDNDYQYIQKLLETKGFTVAWYLHGKQVKAPPAKKLTMLEAHQ